MDFLSGGVTQLQAMPPSNNSKSGLVPTYYAAVRLDLRNISCNSDLRSVHLKISTPITPLLECVHTNLIFFLLLFRFRVRSPYMADRQTDGRAREVTLPIKTHAL